MHLVSWMMFGTVDEGQKATIRRRVKPTISSKLSIDMLGARMNRSLRERGPIPRALGICGTDV
jgi:hypothetical protein